MPFRIDAFPHRCVSACTPCMCSFCSRDPHGAQHSIPLMDPYYPCDALEAAEPRMAPARRSSRDPDAVQHSVPHRLRNGIATAACLHGVEHRIPLMEALGLESQHHYVFGVLPRRHRVASSACVASCQTSSLLEQNGYEYIDIATSMADVTALAAYC